MDCAYACTRRCCSAVRCASALPWQSFTDLRYFYLLLQTSYPHEILLNIRAKGIGMVVSDKISEKVSKTRRLSAFFFKDIIKCFYVFCKIGFQRLVRVCRGQRRKIKRVDVPNFPRIPVNPGRAILMETVLPIIQWLGGISLCATKKKKAILHHLICSSHANKREGE